MQKLISTKKTLLMILAGIFIISALQITPVSAASTRDGLGTVYQNTTVYKSSDLNVPIGTVYAYETFTVFDWQFDANWNQICYIEYSTANGPKKGYVLTNSESTGYTCVTTVKSNANVYSGNDSSIYVLVGTVYSSENVVVLGESNGWSYIEYNTTSGRKRGYVSTSKLGTHSKPEYGWSGFRLDSSYNNRYVSGKYTIYSGDKTTYTTVGSINNETVRVYYESKSAAFITYSVSGTNKRKAGWIVYSNI